jgi:hypothetical protein
VADTCAANFLTSTARQAQVAACCGELCHRVGQRLALVVAEAAVGCRCSWQSIDPTALAWLPLAGQLASEPIPFTLFTARPDRL